MQRAGRRILAAAVWTALCGASLGDGAVWIVDDQAGPGVAFQTIQEAVDAADQGDAIVVRAGQYAGFAIGDKDLTIVTVPGEVVDIPIPSVVSVTGLSAGRTVALRGIRGPRLVLLQNAGAVWVEGILARGLQAPGIEAHDCASIVLTGCEASGSPGLLANNASVSATISSFRADYAFSLGQNHGVMAEGSTLLVLAECIAQGGTKAWRNCIKPGDGLRVAASAQAFVIDSELEGGGVESFCTPSPPGKAVVGPATMLAGSANPFERSIPAGPLASARAAAGGQTGDLLYVFGSAHPAFAYFPSLQGAILVSPQTVTSVEIPGYVERSRELVFQSPTPPLPPGRSFLRSFQQVALERVDGSVRIGGPSLGLVFDAALGLAPDCDGSGRSDALELAQGLGDDCNANGVLDPCDIASGTSFDCDLDGIPDDCARRVPDCDQDGVPDACEVAQGAPDCNANTLPDACEGDWLLRSSSIDPGLALGDAFGCAVALDGEWMAVGARGDGRLGWHPGSVSIFRRLPDGGWSFHGKVVATDGRDRDRFGTAVALDGGTLAVSAPFHGTDGAVYVFRFLPGPDVWDQSAKFLSGGAQPTGRYGTAVAVRESDPAFPTVAVGAPINSGPGSVYVYHGPFLQHLTAPSALLKSFGHGVALDGDDLLVCGNEQDPSAVENTYVYTRAGGLLYGSPQPLTTRGRSVAIDGDRLAVGRRGQFPFTLEIFERDAFGTWLQTQIVTPTPVGQFADLMRAIALDGDWLAVGAPGLFNPPDAVHLFERDAGGTFVARQTLLLPLPGPLAEEFGAALALRGQDLAIGASSAQLRGLSGALRIYRPTFDRNADGLPDECQLILEQESYTPGADLVLSTFGGLEGDTIAFFFGTSGASPGMGPCLVPGAPCFDLLDPIFTLGSATVDRLGLATLAVPIDGDPILVQAVNVRSVAPPRLVYSGVLAAP